MGPVLIGLTRNHCAGMWPALGSNSCINPTPKQVCVMPWTTSWLNPKSLVLICLLVLSNQEVQYNLVFEKENNTIMFIYDNKVENGYFGNNDNDKDIILLL